MKKTIFLFISLFSFLIYAQEADYVSIEPSCNNGNGFGKFNIQALIPLIQGSQTSNVVTFHPTQVNAENNTNIFTNDWSEFVTLERTIYARVENSGGIYSTVSIFLDVNNCPPTMPNAFSPNADNTNDLYKVNGLKDVFKDFKFTVFNRWGNLVFETDNSKTRFVSGLTGPAVLWDGSVNGVLSNQSEAETLYYVLELNDGVNAPIKGWIYVNP
jgi:gliding motility-associated-like protein